MSEKPQPNPRLCGLCGGPNDCAQAASAVAGAGADPGSGAAAGRCWCMDETFPAALLVEATSIDQGASCICRSCLARGSSGEAPLGGRNRDEG